MLQRILLLLMVMIVSVSTGCTSYVNIPAQDGDIAIHNPNNETFRRAATVALKRMLAKYPPNGHYMLEMPAGTSDWTYKWVMNRLPQPQEDAPTDIQLPLYSLKQARLRNSRAEMDIVHPTVEGPRLTTVFLEWDPWGWHIKRERIWRVSIEDALILARPTDLKAIGDAEPEPEGEQKDPLSSTDKEE